VKTFKNDYSPFTKCDLCLSDLVTVKGRKLSSKCPCHGLIVMVAAALFMAVFVASYISMWELCMDSVARCHKYHM